MKRIMSILMVLCLGLVIIPNISNDASGDLQVDIVLVVDYWNLKSYSNMTNTYPSDLYNDIPYCKALVGKNDTSDYWYTYWPSLGLTENWTIKPGDGLFILVTHATTWQINIETNGSGYTRGDMWIDGNLSVSGNSTMDYNLTVNGSMTIQGNFNVNVLTVTGDLDVNGNLTVDNDLTVGNNLTVNGSLMVVEDITISGNLTVTQDASIGGDFEVTGGCTVTGDLTVSGDIFGSTGRTATYVIASYQSTALNKAQADYVCDSVADDIQVQIAIDNLPTIGGKIVLLEGNYTFDNQVTRAINDICIEGQGPGTYIELDGFTPVFSAGDQSGWTFTNFGTDAGFVDKGTKQSTIQDMWRIGAPYYEFNYKNPYIGYVGVVSDSGHKGSHDIYVRDSIAYVCNYWGDTLTSIDISDPENPVVLDHLTNATTLDGIHDIVGNKDHVYVTCINRDSIACINISDPSNMIFESEIIDSANLGGVHALSNQGNWVYAGAYDDGNNRIAIINVTDPSNITLESEFIHSNFGGTRGTYPNGNLLYVVSKADGYLSIVNVTDKSSPSMEGSIQLVSVTGSYRLTYVKVKGNYAYCGGLKGLGYYKLFVVDISDPTSPSLETYIEVPAGYITIHENYLFATTSTYDLLTVVDISDPTNPFIISSYRNSVDLPFGSGIFIYGEYVLVSDRDTDNKALTILKILGETESRTDMFLDVLAEDVNYIVDKEDLTQSIPLTCTIANQPDIPRNIGISINDSDTSITDFYIRVFGRNAKGDYEVECFEFGDGLVQTGIKAFSEIIQVEVKVLAGDNAGDLLNVSVGSKLGLSSDIRRTGQSPDVYKVKKNNADYLLASYTVNVQYDTVDVSTGGAISGGDDFTIWYKTCENID